MTPLSARLSRNIATRRRQLGLTQAQLAERLQVETETLSRFERGKHLPSLLSLERLAGVLQTTVADLLEEEFRAPDDQALAVAAWLGALKPADRQFVTDLIKRCCDHLAARREGQ